MFTRARTCLMVGMSLSKEEQHGRGLGRGLAESAEMGQPLRTEREMLSRRPCIHSGPLLEQPGGAGGQSQRVVSPRSIPHSPY